MLVYLLGLAACSRVYYAGLEKMGIPKRDLLESRVESAQDAQRKVKEQFGSALDRFRASVSVQGGTLAERYDALRAELERCETRAAQLGDRIEAVEDVAEALFVEWQDELNQYERQDLRAASAHRLQETRRRYSPMIAAMKRAHQRVKPVLGAMRDIVLALKHQLNAKALGQLDREVNGIERDVNALVSEMNRSIEQATRFLSGLDEGF